MSNVLEGPRQEWRRVLYQGQEQWVKPNDINGLLLPDGREISDEEVDYLPPCNPTKIICVHLNYDSRRLEFNMSELVTPTYFHKPTTALNSHRGTILRPEGCKYLNYEGELAVVIGKPMRNIPPEETWGYIAGFSPANDVGLHDFRDTDAGSMLRVKGMDGFCPIGPGIVSGVNVIESVLRTYLDGEVVQEAFISEMVFGIDYLLADLCRYITLLPGDVVLTGTPAHSRPMEPGSVVEVEITGIGRLVNTVGSAPKASTEIGHQPMDSKQARAVSLGSDYIREKEKERRSDPQA
ncbi:MAG: fumarylacetoacetate hydrolase family protein [Actinobacteria bacterium]|nr:fumarylacetoacetate hydrolase family protein [Actinomycetota bacterium]MCL6095460.1 fumarylacetoacetate hydrolase family protein [Actinomycetota bacterium]